jgi:hypothetical protein
MVKLCPIGDAAMYFVGVFPSPYSKRWGRNVRVKSKAYKPSGKGMKLNEEDKISTGFLYMLLRISYPRELPSVNRG